MHNEYLLSGFSSQTETRSIPANVSEFKVQLLDGETQKFQLPKRTLGSELFDRVCFNLELVERDFFGLQYVDSDNVSHWLELNKKIKRQVDIAKNVYMLSFKVKFFPSQPQTLKEERTKYYFYWQIKQVGAASHWFEFDSLTKCCLFWPVEMVISFASFYRIFIQSFQSPVSSLALVLSVGIRIIT